MLEQKSIISALESKNQTIAELQGELAFKCGQSIDTNPYCQVDDRYHCYWEKGYKKALNK